MTVPTTNSMAVHVFPPARQARGAFDGGKITERKPIGFPGEGSAARRLGPLFYWAWATSHSPALIGMHPHRGFEIMSYVLSGTLSHRDTLGTRSTVGAGGAQMMQTGSGVSHEEETLDQGTEFFQIWFEPELTKALRREPEYRDFQSRQLPTEERNGVSIKHVLGPRAPMSFVADASLKDARLTPGSRLELTLEEGRVLAMLCVSGEGALVTSDGETADFEGKDFIVVEGGRSGIVEVRARAENECRLAIVETALHVDYPIYQG